MSPKAPKEQRIDFDSLTPCGCLGDTEYLLGKGEDHFYCPLVDGAADFAGDWALVGLYLDHGYINCDFIYPTYQHCINQMVSLPLNLIGKDRIPCRYQHLN